MALIPFTFQETIRILSTFVLIKDKGNGQSEKMNSGFPFVQEPVSILSTPVLDGCSLILFSP